MQPLYDLKGASLAVAGKDLLRDADLQLSRGRVTAVMGPVATGKSVFMSALAGRLHADVERGGHWHYNGDSLPRDGGAPGILWLPQPKGEQRRSRGLRSVLEGLSDARDALLVDEPEFGLSEDETRELKDFILARRGHVSLAMVTHNLDLARACADDVLLLCASDVVASGSAGEFFDSPPNELSKEWLSTGNCWPKRKAPPLPKGFHWILPRQLAGMAWPGLMGDTEEELEAIALAGVTQLVTLTESPFPRAKLAAFGIEGRHLPIADMGVPGVSNTIRACRGIQRAIEAEGAVAVHCRAGLGRTGTILACYLIYQGADPEDAITRVRAHNPNYIQSASQLEFVRNFRG